MLTRRDVLRLAGAGVAAASATPLLAQTPPLRHVGATPAGFPFRTRVPGFDMVEYTHARGLSAVQTRMPDPTPDATRAFRQRLETYQMRAVLGVRLPQQDSDLPAFDTAIKTAKDVNAVCVHAAMTGRRYEDFDTLAAFQASFARNRQAVTLAEPVLRKHRVKLAIENHKGWRAAEQAAWLTAVGSEYVGVCFDFGNNISLCEEPMESLRLLAPFTFYTHLKDMAVEPYDDGFLLSEVPLGEGVLDIPAIVALLRAKDPEMILGLEMITRDPLKIPVFTDKYWVSFADASSPLPGSDLARTLRMVKQHPPKQPLPRTTGLAFEAQLQLEDDCIARCLQAARAMAL
jgi:sugar phosphate isomerase/epimerase